MSIDVNYYILGQTTAPEGKKGKLVTLGSRKELDCLVQFINDEFGEPTFEVKRGRVSKGNYWEHGLVSIVVVLVNSSSSMMSSRICLLR